MGVERRHSPGAYRAGDHPLFGVIAKLRRGEQHFREVQSQVVAYASSNAYDLALARDYKGRSVLRYANVSHPGPELSVLIGDCVHNFRSALDHLAYELATAHTIPFPDGWVGSTAFPIFQTGPKFRQAGSRGARHKMRGMSRGAQATIERLQPYHRRKEPATWALWQLKELSDIDKHRLMHLTAAHPIRGTGEFPFIHRASAEIKIEKFMGPIENGGLFARITGAEFDPAGAYVRHDETVDVVFDEDTAAKSVRGESVLNTLQNIRDCVGTHVLQALWPEVQRLFPGLGLNIKVAQVGEHEIVRPRR